MNALEALILGIIQGLTEFLPVSSSGHLEIGQALLGTSGEENLTFAIIVHVATVLSTIVVLWKEVVWLLKGDFSTLKWNSEKDYTAKIFVSMIPIFFVGVFAKDYVEELFGNGLLLVGICLIITASLLSLSEYICKRREKQANSGEEVGRDVSYKDAIIIGLSQAVAILPGLSRSGTTIATGLLCGVKKSAVAQFSFLMVLIPILGEALLDTIDYIQAPEAVTALPVSSMIIGFVAAFATGCLACKFMIGIVKKQKLVWFALYCLVVGLFSVIYSFVI